MDLPSQMLCRYHSNLLLLHSITIEGHEKQIHVHQNTCRAHVVNTVPHILIFFSFDIILRVIRKSISAIKLILRNNINYIVVCHQVQTQIGLKNCLAAQITQKYCKESYSGNTHENLVTACNMLAGRARKRRWKIPYCISKPMFGEASDFSRSQLLKS